MKRFIKSLLNDTQLFHLREIKNKFLPGETHRREKESIDRCKFFYSRFVNNGDLCFDVGANMGNKVEPLLELNAIVVAIEPQSSCLKYLQMKYGKKIILVPKGVGSKEELKEFYVSDSNTISSFSKEWIDEVKKNRFKDSQWKKVNDIPITTLDKLIDLYGVPVFIKIDVEGFELDVLNGLSKPINMISYEYTVPEQTQIALECLARIYSVNSNIQCNYSVSDKMEFAMKNWTGYDEMRSVIAGREFIQSGNGDIYVKNKSYSLSSQ